jgi:FKBP-type peptidyl-prolyl cis-trans isomerase 2
MHQVYPEGTTDEGAVADTAPVVLSSPEGGLTTTAGESPLCPGLAIALRTMKVKESANITLKPECE